MSVKTVAPPINPCPFCGDKGPEAVHSTTFDLDSECVWIECENCLARGPVARVGCRQDEFDAGEVDLELDAITDWNRAAMSDSAPEE